MSIHEAIATAEAMLPGEPAPVGNEDARWQAIITVGDYVENNPDEVWLFTARWGRHEHEDVRMAVATCLLEHLLEHHFDLIFPRVEELARQNRRFADTFGSCWKFGQSELPTNAKRFDRLRNELADGGS